MFARTLCLAAFAAFISAGSAVAGPTAQKAWVSGTGADSASCGAVASPCRTFQYANENIVAAGGSIYVMDAANYGVVTISKSISIINVGSTLAVIPTPSGVGVTITGGASVVLQGLLIDGYGTAATGVAFTSGGSLTVSNCSIQGFTGAGVSVIPGGGGNVVIANSLIVNNGTGVYTSGDSSGTLTISLSHDEIVNNGFAANGFGVRATGGSAAYQFMTIEASHIAQNGTGLSVEANGSNIVEASLFDVRVLDNSKSINVAAGAVRLEKTSVQAYFPSAITNSGSIVSYGDNAIVDSVSGSAITTTSLK